MPDGLHRSLGSLNTARISGILFSGYSHWKCLLVFFGRFKYFFLSRHARTLSGLNDIVQSRKPYRVTSSRLPCVLLLNQLEPLIQENISLFSLMFQQMYTAMKLLP